ncbi:DUF4238 domain-containing protein [Mucilaginibacter sp. OK098]|uniref:DUF4238 domain-containing protein n=1 Tax=Mucilaginibacter sp. OK098 TaxID=1855297 RepID=UPI00091DD6D1|nr:DUF4238 domain-containing protein [Mucilaginibacter sp. OK098]SHN26096.1 Protein of unknown function [Mucilaginibacter sp. OK098]
MSEPKHHHYVPRFYLKRFVNLDGKLWIYDKSTNKQFSTTPEHIAGENQFYWNQELQEQGHDPLSLEKQFAELEADAAGITNDWFRQFSRGKQLIIPKINREIMSLYIATQLLRTAEARQRIVEFSQIVNPNYDAGQDARQLHISLMWDEDLVNSMRKRIYSCIWMFGLNNSGTTFLTSDHPVLIKNFENTQWLSGPVVHEKGMYIVFPMTPQLIMYAKDPKYWKGAKIFKDAITPVEFDDHMVKHENSGQIGMSNRFVFSNENNFEFAKEFLADNEEFKNPKRSRFVNKPGDNV